MYRVLGLLLLLLDTGCGHHDPVMVLDLAVGQVGTLLEWNE